MMMMMVVALVPVGEGGLRTIPSSNGVGITGVVDLWIRVIGSSMYSD